MGTLMRRGRVEATTTARPEQVWAVLSDIGRIGEWSHECHNATWLAEATAPVVGARFVGGNSVGRTRWLRTNEIIVADAPRQLAWRTVPSRLYRDSTEWHIVLEPHDGGTRIVQTFTVLKLNPVADRLIYAFVKAHRNRLAALNGDIERLGRIATSATVSATAP
jgi:hypothetical protein